MPDPHFAKCCNFTVTALRKGAADSARVSDEVRKLRAQAGAFTNLTRGRVDPAQPSPADRQAVGARFTASAPRP